MQDTEVPPELAESYLLKMFERGIIPGRHLQRVIQEYRTPSFEEFKAPTFWSLLNAVTTTLGETFKADPQKYALRTMRLTAMLSQDPRLN